MNIKTLHLRLLLDFSYTYFLNYEFPKIFIKYRPIGTKLSLKKPLGLADCFLFCLHRFILHMTTPFTRVKATQSFLNLDSIILYLFHLRYAVTIV